MVFLTTARQTQLFAEVFNLLQLPGLNPALEIHSRKSQPQRTRVSDEFRNAESAILFSSDVSARGMDYPDVSFVMQVGVPSDKAQYVHRLGRTARAGKGGQGLLVLADFEVCFFVVVFFFFFFFFFVLYRVCLCWSRVCRARARARARYADCPESSTCS